MERRVGNVRERGSDRSREKDGMRKGRWHSQEQKLKRGKDKQ